MLETGPCTFPTISTTMVKNGASSPSMLVPLKKKRSYHGDNNTAHCQLAAVTQITNTSRFTLPNDWVVQRVPRRDGSRVDKYYFDPETGQRFRSLKAVERYVNGEVYTPKRGALKILREEEEETNRYQLPVVAPTMAATSLFNHPYGLVVEEVPRRCGGFTDKYYYEPGAGQKLQSLIAVEGHPAEQKGNRPVTKAPAGLKDSEPMSKVFKLENHGKNSGSWKKNTSREKVPTSTLTGPPMKINWVLASPGGDTRNPFISEMLAPESLKQQWSSSFMLYINNRNHGASNTG